LRQDGNVKIKIWLAGILACGISSTAPLGQQSATPQPADSGPSLAATMQFIQNTLRERGKLTFVVHTNNDAGGDTAIQETSEISNVVADPAAGTIGYHYKKTGQGNVLEDDYKLNLHDVHSVVVIPFEQYALEEHEKEKPYLGDQPGWYAKFDPPIFLVLARGPGDEERGVDYADEKMAHRIADALSHAVELCGGSIK
jgi:hypothetical protein